MKQIYLDNAATTKVSSQVLKAMLPYFSQEYGNPSEYHVLGRHAKKALENARRSIAANLGCNPTDIVFTSGATESINLAHKGLVEAMDFSAKQKPHIITSAIEHKAVLETCKHLEKSNSASVTYLPVDEYGLVGVDALEKALQPNTILVSLMYVNNEVGTIEPIREIAQIIKKYNLSRNKQIYFHTDATQAISYLECNVNDLGVDLLSLTGHKLNAPKGIGALYIREGTLLKRQNDGGGQEKGRRSGTENVAAIVGLAKALNEACFNKKIKSEKILQLRDYLINKVSDIPGVRLTGHPQSRAPHIASFVIEDVEGEALVLALSDKGIYVSSGSACTAADLNASHVLSAMGIPPEVSHGSLRFSLSAETTKKDIDYVLKVLPKIIKRLRRMTPPAEYLTI